MAIQKHILVLHKRKKQNANAMWVMVLGCLTLCSMTTLCLLFNDWSLLPQAYNPKPLILGEALFDLSPDLFPLHQPEIGKLNKYVKETKKRRAKLVKRCNDSSCLSFLNIFRGGKKDGLSIPNDSSSDKEQRSMLSSSSDLSSMGSTVLSTINTDSQSENGTGSPSTKGGFFHIITVLMRKRSTDDEARPSLRMQKSLSLGSGERKEAKVVKERNKMMQTAPTQSQPSSPARFEHFEVDSKPRKSIIVKSKSKKRFRPEEHISFARIEKVQTIRNRVPPEKGILYNTEGEMRTALKPDRTIPDGHASVKETSTYGKDKYQLVKRSGLPPLVPTNQYEGEWRADPSRRIRTTETSSRSHSPAISHNESPDRAMGPTLHLDRSRRASYSDVQDVILHREKAVTQDELPTSHQNTDRHVRASIRRKARTPSPTPSPRMASEGRRSRTVQRGSPAHAVSPYHENKQIEGRPGHGRRRSFDSVSERLDRLGDLSPSPPSSPSTPTSPFSPFTEAGKSSFRSKDSPRERRVSFEGTDDYRSRGSSNSPRIISTRSEEHAQGLLDALHISTIEKRKKGNFQKRSKFDEEASQMKKRCFGLDCLSFFKSKTDSGAVELLPLRSKNFENRKSRLSASSSISYQSDVKTTAPQRQAFTSSTRTQSPLSSANKDRDLRKLTLKKNALSPNRTIKVVKRSFSDKDSVRTQSSSYFEDKESPRLTKSILKTKETPKSENPRLRRVTFLEGTNFFPSSKPRQSFRRSGSVYSKNRNLYNAARQSQRSSSFSERLKLLRISNPAHSGSVQATSATELNRNARRPYVSSSARFTNHQGRRLSNIVRRSDRTSSSSSPSENVASHSSDSEETLSSISSSDSNFSKRAISDGVPTKSSLRRKTEPHSKKRVTFAETIPDQPSSPQSPTKHEPDMSATKPTVLQHTASSASLDRGHNVKPSTTSSSSSSSGYGTSRPSTASSHSTSSGIKNSNARERLLNMKSNGSPFMNKDPGRKMKSLYKRDFFEKRAKKRKLHTVPSSESFIHTADHHARYGASTSAAAPPKKLKQQQLQRSATASDLSPSNLGFAGLHITSNAGSLSTSSRESVSPRQLQRSDSLRSTGSSSFRRLDSSPQHFHTSPQVSRPGSPASPSAQHGEWWNGDHSSTSSSGGGVPFVYK